jgi:hypothetical protein
MGKDMRINITVFETLRDSLSPDRLSQGLERILRVPEAWEKLQEPGFMDRISEQDLEWSLTPANLALLALGYPDRSSVADPLSADDKVRLDELWQTVLEGSSNSLSSSSLALAVAPGLCLAAH